MNGVDVPQRDGLIGRPSRLEKPAEIVQTGAACLARMLDGFTWVSSRQSLERRGSGRREVITLEKSKRNRSGHLVKFIVASLTVFDDDLAAWRRANRDLTVDRPEPVRAIVCASSFLDMSSEYAVVLTRPEKHWPRLEQGAAHLRDTALFVVRRLGRSRTGCANSSPRAAHRMGLRPGPDRVPRQLRTSRAGW